MVGRAFTLFRSSQNFSNIGVFPPNIPTQYLTKYQSPSKMLMNVLATLRKLSDTSPMPSITEKSDPGHDSELIDK